MRARKAKMRLSKSANQTSAGTPGALESKMQDWLAAQAHARPDGIALIATDRVWTYKSLNQAVGQMAGALLAAGVQRGDFVAALLPNSAEYVFLIHALARLGAVLIPLNTRLTSAELAHPLKIVNAR